MIKQKKAKNFHVKRGDTVIVISGKDKGKVSTLKDVNKKDNKVVVEGVNVITKAVKANPMKGVQGGLVKIEAPIRSSKVMLYCPKCEKPTRIQHQVLENDVKTRVCKHCNEHLDV